MKKILIVVSVIFFLSGCGAYEKRGDRLILKDWKLTYFPKGFTGGEEMYYPEYPTLEECKNAGLNIIKENKEADFFCGTNCILVKDGIEPRHCENGVAAKCSNGICQYIENPETDSGSINVD